MSEIRADLSQYYPVKALFEKILGKEAFLKVKDYGDLGDWKKNYNNLFRAVEISAEATVEIVDEDWKAEFKAILELGRKLISGASSIDELHADVAAIFGSIIFLQLGFIPNKNRFLDKVRLVPNNWKLNAVRSVQYVQTAEQKQRQLYFKNTLKKDA